MMTSPRLDRGGVSSCCLSACACAIALWRVPPSVAWANAGLAVASASDADMISCDQIILRIGSIPLHHTHSHVLSVGIPISVPM